MATSPGPGPVKRARILVVDDEPGVRSILADFVQALGHEVVLAENGEDALEQIAKTPVTLVLTDLIMPRMNGLQLARELRRRLPAMKILVVSGSSGPVDAEAIRDAGFAFLGKPVSFQDFQTAVEHELGLELT